MIFITPEAVNELRALTINGNPAVLRFDASPDGEGSYDCSVDLVDAIPPDATVEDVEGISVAYCGAAESVFAGAVVGVNEDGELMLEMDEGDCDSCHHHDECGHDEHGGHAAHGGCC